MTEDYQITRQAAQTYWEAAKRLKEIGLEREARNLRIKAQRYWDKTRLLEKRGNLQGAYPSNHKGP